MYKLFYAAACFLTSIAICTAAPVIIDGTATVKMDIKNPIPSEQTAKNELNTYIKRIFAAYPGKSSAGAQFILRHDPALDEQEQKELDMRLRYLADHLKEQLNQVLHDERCRAWIEQAEQEGISND